MHVLGSGSLGCLWAARLAAAGSPPTLLLRPGSAKASLCLAKRHAKIRLECLTLPEKEGSANPNTKTLQVSVPVDIADGSLTIATGRDRHLQGSAVKNLLLLTKAPDAESALRTLSPRLNPGAVVFILCNGALALHDKLASLPELSNINFVLGMTTHGAWSRADFDVVHAGLGETWFGRPPDSGLTDSAYQDALTHIGLAGLGNVDLGFGILRHLWLKLAANAAINPVTALRELPNGCILSSPEAASLALEVCKEVAALAEQTWCSQGGVHGSPPSAKDLHDFVLRTAEKTAANRSSMLQDVQAGRQTEVDFLNGWIAKRAAGLGIAVPVNADLADQVRSKEASIICNKEL
eukprot:TRINITY_DN27969_c0_g1_i1.p1 TRINITY_DN27969_c0_g1~~TRINITY_DN27969_c0_g1_i1.p1  ORF type:complete len:351 (+),score=86.22 TRINITY_DN27969_c0_g1_i1:48-1100(+)